MASIGSPQGKNPLIRVVKGLVMPPVLFIRALPYVTVQISTFGAQFLKRPVVWAALGVHAALLVLPAVDLSAPEKEKIVEDIPEEEAPIGAVSLSDILAPSEPVPPAPEKPETPPETPPPTSAEIPVLTEVPEDIEEVLDDDDDDIEDDDIENDENNEDEQQQAFISQQRDAFQSGLNSLVGLSDAGSDVNNTDDWFVNDSLGLQAKADDAAIIQGAGGDLGAFFTQASVADGTYQPLNSNGFKVIGLSQSDIERGGLGQALRSNNMSIDVLGDYGGYPLQGIATPDGHVVSYLMLIELFGKTLVFTWPEDPR